ncbi:MAG: hypothetical protein Q9200_000342 [Gallowayella weberi]
MDTHLYLTRQGWHGTGHALQSNGQGISKPLLVSQKTNVLGVGKKAHDVHADQWWARAFDETLKGLNGQTTTKPGARSIPTPASTPSSVLPTRWAGNGGLYGGFVRGEGLEGTMEAKREAVGNEFDAQRPTKKRRSEGSAESRTKGVRIPSQTRSEQSSNIQPAPQKTKKRRPCPPADKGVTMSDSRDESDSNKGVSWKGMLEANQACVDNAQIEPSVSAYDTTKPERVMRAVNEATVPISTAADTLETSRPGNRTKERRNKRKERKLREPKSKAKAAQEKPGSVKLSDQSSKKMEIKRRKDEDGSGFSLTGPMADAHTQNSHALHLSFILPPRALDELPKNHHE